jgi:hypothetical protein
MSWNVWQTIATSPGIEPVPVMAPAADSV